MFSRNARVGAAAAVVVAAFVGQAATQSQPAYQTHNLTPDGYWHNRYHALLSMASYGFYNDTCPIQTFTEASMVKNFPNSTRPPWTLLETWSTPSGCEGFSAIVPEMNKILLIFKGNYQLEQNISLDVTPWSSLDEGIGETCEKCTMNQFALQGYLEAKNATNNWNLTRSNYYNSGLVFSIAGHGLGGMHSLIASADFNYQLICYYSHTYGSPRVFNQAGVNWYNARFNGEAGERGIFNNDVYTESIEASDDYVHAGTPFFYWGQNATNGNLPNWDICWPDANNSNPNPPECMPRNEAGTNTTAEEDHYFYFTPVGQCGLPSTPRQDIIDSFLEFEEDPANEDAVFSYTSSFIPWSSTSRSVSTYGSGRYRTTVTLTSTSTSSASDHFYTPSSSSSSSSSSSYSRYSSSSSSSYSRPTSSSTSSSYSRSTSYSSSRSASYDGN